MSSLRLAAGHGPRGWVPATRLLGITASSRGDAQGTSGALGLSLQGVGDKSRRHGGMAAASAVALAC